MQEEEKIVERDRQLVARSSRVHYFPLVVAKGRGAKVIDVNGKTYIDLLSSAAVANTGHSHPKVVEAIVRQAEDFIHYAPIYMYHRPQVELAEKLVDITPGNFKKRVRFGLSGSDAIDAVMKFARAYTKRQKIVSFLGSYHGSTYAALSLSGINLNMRRRMGPLVPEVYHIPYPDCYRCRFNLEPSQCSLDCLHYIEDVIFKHLVPPEEIAAIVVEPIQGDAGILVPKDEYLPKLQKLCEKYEILFVAEEVQTGFGRTGKWFAVEHWGIEPDILVLGKAMASGMPLSALVAKAPILESLDPPADLLTFKANPICCAAAIATIEVIREENLVEKSAELGKYMRNCLLEMKEEHELIGDVRGRGLCIGVDLVKDRKTKKKAKEEALKVCWRSFERGLLLVTFSESVLRIQPPLVITKQEIDTALDVIDQSLKDVEEGRVGDDVLKRMEGW